MRFKIKLKLTGITKYMFKKPDRKILTVILMAACFISANSKGYSQSRTIIKNVNEALSLAMKNNSEIVKANIDKLIAEEKVSEVYSENLVPTISLNSRYSRAFKKQVFDIFGEKIEIGSDNSFTNSIDVTEALPILGTPVFSGIRIAEYFLKTQQENLIAVQDEVKYNVKRAYYGVQLTKAVVDVNKLTLENAQNNFNTVARYRNGVATEFDYLRSK
ncbi:MAG: TolC family protein [Ignavibacteria bacterium]|nr:TolC family protein [Ignavibacteria bacterium]